MKQISFAQGIKDDEEPMFCMENFACDWKVGCRLLVQELAAPARDWNSFFCTLFSANCTEGEMQEALQRGTIRATIMWSRQGGSLLFGFSSRSICDYRKKKTEPVLAGKTKAFSWRLGWGKALASWASLIWAKTKLLERSQLWILLVSLKQHLHEIRELANVFFCGQHFLLLEGSFVWTSRTWHRMAK